MRRVTDPVFRMPHFGKLEEHTPAATMNLLVSNESEMRQELTQMMPHVKCMSRYGAELAAELVHHQS